MNAAETGKLRLFQPGNHLKNSFLFTVFHLGLKTDQIAQRVFLVVLPQLNHGIRFFRTVRIGQSHRFHRAENQSFDASFRHHFNRQAAVKIVHFFPVVKFGLFRFQQSIDKLIILFFGEWAVDVIKFVAFVIAGLIPRFAEVNALLVNHRSYCIVKGEGLPVNFR